MNDLEAARFIRILQAEYSGHPIPDVDLLIDSWMMMLGDVPTPAVAEAIRRWLATGERFFPTSGQILQLVAAGVGALPSGAEAWSMVLSRMKATYPGHPAPPWDAPEPVKRALAAVGGMDAVRMHEQPEILRGQFLKLYDSFARGAAGSPEVLESIVEVGPASSVPIIAKVQHRG